MKKNDSELRSRESSVSKVKCERSNNLDGVCVNRWKNKESKETKCLEFQMIGDRGEP